MTAKQTPLAADRRGPRSIQEWVTIIMLAINLIGFIWITATQNAKNEAILTQVQQFQSSQTIILSGLIEKVNLNTINLAVVTAKLDVSQQIKDAKGKQ